MKPIIEAFTRNEARLSGCGDFQNGIRNSFRNSFRIFHGRGGAYPNHHWCNIDYFHPVILVTLYQKPREDWLAQLSHFLARQQENHILRGVLIQRRYLPGSPTEFLMDEPTEQIYARRGELEFKLSFSQQNCGYFLDIEPARQWLEKTVRVKPSSIYFPTPALFR